MIPKKYVSEGIVLARRNYSEADRILVVFSEKYGKLSLLAKGVRRPKSRKRAHIEIFNRINFSAVSGKGMDIITEVEVIDAYSDVKKSLKKVALAYFFMEVAGRMIHEGERQAQVYQDLKYFLDKLRIGGALNEIRKEYISKMLINLGFWPEDKVIIDPDRILEEVLERPQFSLRVGKKLLA